MLSIIAAKTDKTNVIGKGNKLPWSLPEDLKMFKEKTTGHTIIMGRKTFESLGRVLPNRHHVVVSDNPEFKVDNENVEVIRSTELDRVFKAANRSDDEVFVIGGAMLYNKAIRYAKKLYITEIYENIEGDVYFPEILEDFWNRTKSTDFRVSESGLVFNFNEYERVKRNNTKKHKKHYDKRNGRNAHITVVDEQDIIKKM